MKKKVDREPRPGFERGSGNVFADLGLSEPQDRLVRARLAEAIDDTIRRRGITQEEAAEIMDADQADVSRVVNGRLDGFSQERLIHYLTALGDDVEIVVRFPRSFGTEGRLTVTTP